jgi:putative sporulation protein YyaC
MQPLIETDAVINADELTAAKDSPTALRERERFDERFPADGFDKPLYIDVYQPDAAAAFSEAFCRLISAHGAKNSELIIICVGTDRATGDSLGPLTGSKLEGLTAFRQIQLYGTLEKPVHAKNLTETLALINRRHPNALTIAIDASLGKTAHIGCLKIGKGSIRPGAGLNKNLPPVGDIYITGIVNFSGMMEAIILQTTKLSLVMKMADVISLGIYSGLTHANSV